MMNNMEYKDIYAFHPGYYIQDIIEDMEITQEEFALRLGTTAKTVSKIVNGESNISKDIALKLSSMLGTSVDLWLNLQSTYDKKVLEIQDAKDLDSQKNIIKEIDYKYFVKLGVVPDTRKSEEKIAYLRNYLIISNLNVLLQPDFLVNYRAATSNISEKNIINSKVWLQTAINIGKKIKTKDFDATKLQNSIPEIRSMTVKKPEEFLDRLKEIFTECGVTFVLLPYLKNSGINGAVKWINHNKVILALNDRRTFADTFWFSLFHEIKHVLQQKHRTIFISGEKIDIQSLDQKLEKEADDFAQEVLIPRDQLEIILSQNNFSDASIKMFASQLGIHPGILLGRLQHENRIPIERTNSLREKYKIIV